MTSKNPIDVLGDEKPELRFIAVPSPILQEVFPKEIVENDGTNIRYARVIEDEQGNVK
jgi:hypothetical protein